MVLQERLQDSRSMFVDDSLEGQDSLKQTGVTASKR
jgi:hypothetical protein